MPRIPAKLRAQVIDELYARFHQPRYLEWDPLSVVRQYSKSPHQEWITLLAALFAFGGVKQIIASLSEALKRIDPERMKSAGEFDFKDLEKRLTGFSHRIYVGKDVVGILRLYAESVKRHGSLERHFLTHHQEGDETIERALAGVMKDYKEWSKGYSTGSHFFHMLNSPEQGSTCKRWLMYLKWVIRKDDGIDLGLWKSGEMKPSELLIPLDTHLFRISKDLGLTRKKTANFKTAIEVTQNLKKYDLHDPTRFDFSLCRFGMFDYRNILEKI